MSKPSKSSFRFRDPRGRFTTRAKYQRGKKGSNARQWTREKLPRRKAPPRGPKAPPAVPKPPVEPGIPPPPPPPPEKAPQSIEEWNRRSAGADQVSAAPELMFGVVSPGAEEANAEEEEEDYESTHPEDFAETLEPEEVF